MTFVPFGEAGQQRALSCVALHHVPKIEFFIPLRNFLRKERNNLLLVQSSSPYFESIQSNHPILGNIFHLLDRDVSNL